MKNDVLHILMAQNWGKYTTMCSVTSKYLALQWNKTGS